jgi:hypothetical protein
MFDGLREAHEPYRHLATQAALAFLATKSPFLAKAAPKLVRPLRYAMQTYEPHLFGHAVWMLAKLLRSHPRVGRALRPHLTHFLGYMGLFRGLGQTVHLPPPFCVAPAGSFTGRETAATSKIRACPVCSAPLDKDAVRLARMALDAAARNGNAHRLNDPQPVPSPPRSPAKGRKCEKVGGRWVWQLALPCARWPGTTALALPSSPCLGLARAARCVACTALACDTAQHARARTRTGAPADAHRRHARAHGSAGRARVARDRAQDHPALHVFQPPRVNGRRRR